MNATRRGMATIVALVALAVLTVTLAVVTVQVVKERQVIAARQRALQAEWLTRASIEWAAARLLDAPAAFREEKKDLADDSVARIRVEKVANDVFAITVEAEVGVVDGPVVARSVSRRFRRNETGGVRLEAVP